MAVTTSGLVSVSGIRASWDLQPRTIATPSHNPSFKNVKNPKKDQHPILQTTNSTTPATTSTPRKDFRNTSELLKLKPLNPIEEEEVEESHLGVERWLPIAPKVKKPRSIYNAASLAYLGDCIYELYARRHFLYPPLNIEEYNDRVMAVVRCEAQDALLKKLLSEDFLLEEERDILRWGKNIESGKTKTTKRAGLAVYNRASSLETLVGYLYLTDMRRLDEVMLKMGFSSGVSKQLILDLKHNPFLVLMCCGVLRLAIRLRKYETKTVDITLRENQITGEGAEELYPPDQAYA